MKNPFDDEDAELDAEFIRWGEKNGLNTRQAANLLEHFKKTRGRTPEECVSNIARMNRGLEAYLKRWSKN